MRKVLVVVTQEDIDLGCRHNANNCPVARAIHRTFGKPVSVDGHTVWRLTGVFGLLPIIASDWIASFDTTGQGLPFHFELELV